MNILKVDSKFQTPTRKAYVFHSRFSMEQDFLDFANNNPNDLDWDYLPILWTHWNLMHDYARTGREELQQAVEDAVVDSNKTFTICQYDNGPQVDIGNIVLFNAAKRDDEGITIPIMGGKLPVPNVLPEKEYLASFVGSYKTDPIRVDMVEAIKDRTDTLVAHSKKNLELFIDTMLKSYVALCPRGSAIGSFRFYEAMQLGVVPIAIGDIDPRPFKKFIDWDSCSFYIESVDQLNELLDYCSDNKESLLEMGKKASQILEDKLYNQNWCKLVLEELKCLTK